MSNKHNQKNRWFLTAYDVLIFILVCLLFFVMYQGQAGLSSFDRLLHCGVAFVAVFGFRFLWGVYHQVWRYGGIQCYIRLLIADACAGVLYLLVNYLTPIRGIAFTGLVSLMSVNCLAALTIRMTYRYLYKTSRFSVILRLFSLNSVRGNHVSDDTKIKIAIAGAGSVGVSLAEDLLSNPKAEYVPRCFIEIDPMKIGRSVHGLPVFPLSDETLTSLKKHEVQEVVFAVPQLDVNSKKTMYETYKQAGFKVKVYDYPNVQTAGEKRHLREFDVEELLFRKPLTVIDDRTSAYYRDKVIMITGGGGSIGSELCRQVAKMQPKQLVLLDIYENGVYDVQQELRIAYGKALDVQIVIVSVTNRIGLERAFRKYRPQIVINAAAHKHVPLMEEDCIEAVENNVFGTLNSVELAEQYGAERFIMVSTDKAVNPTNVMGATKRICEMIVLNHRGRMTCSATRFGNVLGSAGSVIPLFKKQIAAGGPVTITDKRIIRYFMTIPEAAQLVLQSGAMAKDKELFVLDMGDPVRILDLAENMIRLSGQPDIRIVETGLRPGEKLYEELLVKTEELDKTENSMIYIERDKPLTEEELRSKLTALRNAVETDSDAATKQAVIDAVPTYMTPEKANAKGTAPKEPVRV